MASVVTESRIEERKYESRWEGATLAALRIMTGLVFAQHGAQKLLGWFGGMGPGGATAGVGTLPWVAGILELVGGLLVALGLLTRPVAFLLAGEMAVAYFMVHFPRGFMPIVNRGELAVVLCFVFLYLCARGAGPFSVDALFARRRRA
jgi:putative oxidoreductase